LVLKRQTTTQQSEPPKHSDNRIEEIEHHTTRENSTIRLNVKPTLDETDDANRASSDITTLKSETCSQTTDLNKPDFDVDPEKALAFGKCIECVQSVPVFSIDDISIGAHIAFPGALYTHHAIVVDKKNDVVNIVEATNNTLGVIYNFLLSRSVGKIQKSEKTFDFAKDKIVIMHYNIQVFSDKKIADRALMIANDPDNDLNYMYHLFQNNCEHFATFCVIGERYSSQISKLALSLRWIMSGSKAVNGIAIARKRNDFLRRSGMLCDVCFKLNRNLLDVEQRPINQAADVNEGDVILYKYYTFWHNAVVLRLKGATEDFAQVTIAHYAWKGCLLNNSIVEEDILIPLNGTYSVLDYKQPKYSVYPPDVVVQRARRRIGEQLFTLFSNDSSHFTQWCKLTRTRKTIKCE